MIKDMNFSRNDRMRMSLIVHLDPTLWYQHFNIHQSASWLCRSGRFPRPRESYLNLADLLCSRSS